MAVLTFLSDAVERLTGAGRRSSSASISGRSSTRRRTRSPSSTGPAGWSSAPRRSAAGSTCWAATGEPVPAEFIATAWLDENGKFAGANGSVRDMRERERLERDLQESESRYRFLVENSPDVVFSTDAEGNFTFVSERHGADDRLVARPS